MYISVCICIYLYITVYIHMYVYMYTYVYYIYVYVYVYLYICVCISIHICMCVCIYIFIYSGICMFYISIMYVGLTADYSKLTSTKSPTPECVVDPLITTHTHQPPTPPLLALALALALSLVLLLPCSREWNCCSVTIDCVYVCTHNKLLDIDITPPLIVFLIPASVTMFLFFIILFCCCGL